MDKFRGQGWGAATCCEFESGKEVESGKEAEREEISSHGREVLRQTLFHGDVENFRPPKTLDVNPFVLVWFFICLR
jgi:hypothetical protein